MKATCKHCQFQWQKGTDSGHSKDCRDRLKARVEELADLAQEAIDAYSFFNFREADKLDKKLDNLTTEQGVSDE